MEPCQQDPIQKTLPAHAVIKINVDVDDPSNSFIINGVRVSNQIKGTEISCPNCMNVFVTIPSVAFDDILQINTVLEQKISYCYKCGQHIYFVDK